VTAQSPIPAVIQDLSARLIAGATATQTLLAWCDEHSLSEGPITVAIRQCFSPAVVPGDVLPALRLDPGEGISCRHVRLMRGSLPLAAAENWFVPQRLTADMNEALIRTDVPFGRVVAPLRPLRRTLAAHLPSYSEIVLVHKAVILSSAGAALAYVKETYSLDLVSFASAPLLVHRPVNESISQSVTQRVGLEP
jgi:hypothetical protein